MEKRRKDTLYSHIVDRGTISAAAFRKLRQTGKPWMQHDLEEFLEDEAHYLFVMEDHARKMVGFCAVDVSEPGKFKIAKFGISDAHMRTEFADHVFALDEKPVHMQVEDMPKTPDVQLALLAKWTAGVERKVDFLAVAREKGMERIAALFHQMSPASINSQTQSEQHLHQGGDEQGIKVSTSSSNEFGDLPLEERIAQARHFLSRATNMEWQVYRRIVGKDAKPDEYRLYDQKQQELEGPLTSPEGLYFRAGAIKNIKLAQDALQIRIGSFHVPNPDTIGDCPIVPATMVNQILEAELPNRLLEEYFTAKNVWTARETSQYLQGKPYEGNGR